MSVPLVSVIIPVFNAANYLKDSINSVRNQTYPNVEIIVIDDGSTDESPEILKREFSGYTNIKIISTLNHGQSAACNLGFEHSKGDYVKFVDSDDVINSTFIESQVNLVKSDETMVASASWGRFYNDDINTFRLNRESVWRDMKPVDWIVETLETGGNMMQCALWLIPRKILLKSGLWKEELNLNNDFDFIVRVLLASEYIRYSSESVLYYRSGMSNSLSQRKSKMALLSGITSNILGTDCILFFENSERTRNACGKNLSFWLFQTYLIHNDLFVTVENKMKQLGYQEIVYGARSATRKMSSIIGWKFILWIKYFLNLAP